MRRINLCLLFSPEWEATLRFVQVCGTSPAFIYSIFLLWCYWNLSALCLNWTQIFFKQSNGPKWQQGYYISNKSVRSKLIYHNDNGGCDYNGPHCSREDSRFILVLLGSQTYSKKALESLKNTWMSAGELSFLILTFSFEVFQSNNNALIHFPLPG